MLTLLVNDTPVLAAAKDAAGIPIRQNDGEWSFTAGNQYGTFYSALKDIDTTNVGRLGFAWQYVTRTYRGMEGTPVFVAGRLFVPGIWGSVYALDARTGRELWRFDPHADGAYARWAGTDVVSRGVAVDGGRVYTVSTDCRLFALNASNGRVVWKTQTLEKKQPGYMCQSAPQLADDLIVVGNAGGDNLRGGVRGYVSAFSRDDGKLAWRLHTVPSREDKHPGPDLLQAEATWDAKRATDFGGGGTVWGLMAYDPKLKLLYFGTGNAAPYNAPRDWTGGHATDRLYAASIIAVHAKSGQMAWYYQTTPGDVWDFDATMNLVLAEIIIDGAERRVLMQANKNGYFYVLDRVTGQPISATPFAYMNWSTGMGAGFRPIVSRDVNYDESPKLVYPSAYGAHSWPPMSLSATTGLVYVPTIESPNIMADVRKNPGSHLDDLEQSLGVTEIVPDKALSYEFWESVVGRLPRFPAIPPESPLVSSMKPAVPRNGVAPSVRGVLKAIDPRTGRIVWEQQTSQDYIVMDGGVLTTAGGLVFAGREDGTFTAYDAASGQKLKDLYTGSAIMAAPMTYSLDGKQYVTVLCGHGGGILNFLGTPALKYRNEGRVLTFVLDGAPEVPAPALRVEMPAREPPPRFGTADHIATGRNLFTEHCGRCHTLGVVGIAPDLTHSPMLASEESFEAVVVKGVLTPAGMPRFDDLINGREASALRSYLVDQAWSAKESRVTTQVEGNQ